jgi:hypothetical protein
VLDLQLAAAYDFRFEFAESARHARLALAAAERLDMPDARAKALIFLAEAHGMRQKRADMEECLRRARVSVRRFRRQGLRRSGRLVPGPARGAVPGPAGRARTHAAGERNPRARGGRPA